MKRTYIYTILAAAAIALVAFLFFAPDNIEGNVLQQHDIMQGIANGQEGKAFEAATGETTRWTNSLFGGMPNFQIAPTYPANKALQWINGAFGLWLPAPSNLLMAMMIGFFIMALCMGFSWSYALFGALAWGFSSYFIIIIGAGHIWKFITLAYIPPTIGGIALCYRGKYLPGLAMTALFGALQLQSNHPQMTYYFLFVVLALMLVWLVRAIRRHTMRVWIKATVAIIAGGIIAVGANSASLYNSYEYAKETVRGNATDLTPAPGSDTGGMKREAITAWSYGIDETFTLLIPNVKGGATIKPVAGQTQLKSLAETDKAEELSLSPEERQFLAQFPQYFGDQPMTNGPVYVGSFVLLLAIIALFTVPGVLKWALFGVSVLAILLSWGHNFPAFTNFFIDNFPAYNKFRAVSSILVIVEFTIPLLAIMVLRQMATTTDYYNRYKWTLITIGGLGVLICLAGAISPSIFGSPFSAAEEAQLAQAGAFTNPAYANILNAIRTTRLSLVSADSLRSFFFIVAAAAIIYIYLRKPSLNSNVMTLSLAALMVIDLFGVNKRYIDSENFAEPVDNTALFEMSDADRAILQDTTNYRVLDVAGMGSARSSYFHKTIGGYHAAKLTRYNDLLEKQIYNNNPGVLNMLNTKYIMNGNEYYMNPEALGNAWFVDHVYYVGGADYEMAMLDTLNTARYAVADNKFVSVLGEATPPVTGDTIYETTYAPNRLTYKAHTTHGGVAVFSEIFFPWGWQATVNGIPTEIGRVDYVLRALRLPAGNNEIVFTFDPKSTRVTNAIGITSVVLIYLLVIAAIAGFVIHTVTRNRAASRQ